MNTLPLKENLKKYTGISRCPVRNVVARFSGKWSMLVLCVVSENDVTRFNEISKAIPDISPKVLTDTLKNLEADGFISRKLYADVPPKVEYSLTDLGRSLMPHIESLVGWAVDNYDRISRRRR